MIRCYAIVCGDVSLMPLIHDDIEQLRIWRNNCNINRYLRKIGYINSEMQERWYENEIASEDSIIYSIYDNNIVNGLVGTVSIYNIDDDIAKIGRIMIGSNRAHHRGFGQLSMIMAMADGFDNIGIKRYTGEVHKDNNPALKTYEKIGFDFNKSDDFDETNEYSMAIDRDIFYSINKDTISKIKYYKKTGVL